jgi:hypothetical protein
VAAASDLHSFPASLNATPELGEYTQFQQCEVPDRSEASRAFVGFLRPFSDDATAKRVLRALEHDRALDVFGGRLDASYHDLPKSKFEEFLIETAAPFKVLALEFSDSRRPRTYLLDPPMIARLSECTHLRKDRSVTFRGANIPALCVYSGSIFKFEDGSSKIQQMLDQTATYLAKYVVWLSTRNLFRKTDTGATLVRQRAPNDPVTSVEVARNPDCFWRGYWPGRSAPSGSLAHLETIKPTDECWCWSGEAYGNCCMPTDTEIAERPARVRFLRELMAAVRSRLG